MPSPLRRAVRASRGRGLAAALAALWIAVAGPAGAQPTGADKAACMDAYTEAQRLRKDGALLDARTKLRHCADQGCPKLVVDDCTTWLEEVDAAVPTVVIAVRDGQGEDVVDAEVLVDDEARASAVDGTPLELDPGLHTITVRSGSLSVDKQVVARKGDKDRIVEITLGAGEEAEPAPTAQPASTDEDASGGALLVAGGVLAGLGTVGLGVFAGLGAVGAGEASDLNDGCAVTDSCTEDEIDAVRTKLVGADIALAAGATLLAVGVTLIVVDLTGDDGGVADASLTLRGRPGGGFASAQLRF